MENPQSNTTGLEVASPAKKPRFKKAPLKAALKADRPKVYKLIIALEKACSAISAQKLRNQRALNNFRKKFPTQLAAADMRQTTITGLHEAQLLLGEHLYHYSQIHAQMKGKVF